MRTQNSRRWLVTAVLIISLLLAALPATAKGTNKATISGPGLAEPIVVTDVDDAVGLSIAVFEDIDSPVDAPTRVGPAYLLTRLYAFKGTPDQVFDRVLYFPDPDGGLGYVLYVGIEGGWGPYDANWYHVSPEGEQLIQRLLAEHGVTFAGPSAPARTLNLPDRVIWPVAVGLIAAVNAAILTRVVRTRRRHAQPT